jgi:NTE family protein
MFENLCFGGGGVRSVAYIGAIKCLVDYNLHEKTKNFISTSVGAFSAALVAANFEFDEITA